MGNKQSGPDSRPRGGRIREAISNTLAAISEHTSDWKDDDDDSIWDEASLAEDVYSLGHSSAGSFAEDVDPIELMPSIIPLTKKIERAKYRLLKMQSKTLEKRRDIKVELKNFKSEFKTTEKLLGKVAKRAASYFSYFDYFNMVKRSYDVKKDTNLDSTYESFLNSPKKPKATFRPAKNNPMSTALVTQANSFYFSVFALWEAYLLKKAHIAVMQNNQHKVQKKGWNNVILHLTNEREGIIEAFEDQEFELKGNIEAMRAELTALQNAYADLVRCQDRLIQKLQQHENWMSGSQLDAFTTDDEEEASSSDEESQNSIPREISMSDVDISDFAGLSDRVGLSERKDDGEAQIVAEEKPMQHQDDEEAGLEYTKSEPPEDEEVDLVDKKAEQHDGEEVDRNDKTTEQHEDTEDDLEDKIAEPTKDEQADLNIKSTEQHDQEEVDLNDKTTEQHEDEEVNLNDKPAGQHESEENRRNDTAAKQYDDEEDDLDDKSLDLNDTNDQAAKKETLAENTSEKENQEGGAKQNEETGENTTSEETAPVTESDADPDILEAGMSSGSLPSQGSEGSMLSPIELRNENLRDQMKDLKENLRSSMRDLSLEHEEIW